MKSLLTSHLADEATNVLQTKDWIMCFIMQYLNVHVLLTSEFSISVMNSPDSFCFAYSQQKLSKANEKVLAEYKIIGDCSLSFILFYTMLS